MNYIIYKITNIVNGKIYIGKHVTKNINDGYMGSGKLLKRAINKYGIKNFIKEILYSFITEQEMNNKETELVTEEFCLRKDTYNLCVGGHGGFSYINRNKLNRFYPNKDKMNRNKLKQGRLKLKELQQNKDWYNEFCKKVKTGMAQYFESNSGSFKGRTHKISTKLKMSKNRKGTGTGNKNSQYGKCWIHSLNELKSIKINKLDLEKFISIGWIKGRKLKF